MEREANCQLVIGNIKKMTTVCNYLATRKESICQIVHAANKVVINNILIKKNQHFLTK